MIPPLQRAQIVELACLEPVAKGLHVTHWTSEDLADRLSPTVLREPSAGGLSAGSSRRRLATSSDSLLEDGSPGCSVQAAG